MFIYPSMYFKKNYINFIFISNPFHKYSYVIYILPSDT
jgi:hypothetical protein